MSPRPRPSARPACVREVEIVRVYKDDQVHHAHGQFSEIEGMVRHWHAQVHAGLGRVSQPSPAGMSLTPGASQPRDGARVRDGIVAYQLRGILLVTTREGGREGLTRN